MESGKFNYLTFERAFSESQDQRGRFNAKVGHDELAGRWYVRLLEKEAAKAGA